MSHNRGVIRILLLGEENVGKTSLILSLVSEEFSSQVPAQAEEITIPAEITPERVPTTIVDFSLRVSNEETLKEEISSAGVICLVYDVSEEGSFDKLSEYWLPKIRQTLAPKENKTPIILVGNKLDLISQHNMESMIALMNQNNEIETCIDCSAKNLINLTEMFWFAQKAVLYPTAPLYISEKKELTPKCISALNRIFRISDTDNDGYLSDKELGAFQEKCFAIPLPSQSLHDVKKLIRDSCPGGLTINGVSLKGFLYLHLSLIMNSRQETTWTVLRQFGYDNQLKLSRDFLHPNLTVPIGCSTEISPIGHVFLRNLFNKFDMDQDSCLREFELENLFSTCSSPSIETVIKNIGKSVETNIKGWVTRQGFIAYWELMAYFKPKMALEYLAYLGFTYQSTIVDSLITDVTNGLRFDADDPLSNRRYNSGQSSSANITTVAQIAAKNLLRSINVTGEKRIDIIKRHTNRKVFYCRVYGDKEVGKTCFLQGLLHRSIKGTDGLAIGGLSNENQGWAAASGVSVYGQPRTLLLQEISEADGELMSDTEALEADVACLIYDSTDKNSFKYVANVFLNYYNCTSVPCIFIAGKADQPSVPQNYHVDPFEFTSKYNLPDPEPFSSLDINMQTSDLMFLNVNRSGGINSNSAGRRSASSRRSNSNTRQPTLLNDDSAILRSPRSSDIDTLGPLESASGFKGSSRFMANQSMSHNYSTNTSHIEEPVLAQVHPVYAKIATMANYPHLKGLQLAPTDYGWKFGIAATILAGFGFVAFRMAKGHI